jgi:transcriptional/translational regulatory protein YebC/TACO1
VEELELGLIDHGLEELGEGQSDKGERQIIIRGVFASFGQLAAAVEARGITPLSSESEYTPQTLTELPEDKAKDVRKLVDLA